MIEISPQAIDQASVRVRGIWHDTQRPTPAHSEPEGLYSWLLRVAREAINTGDRTESGKYRYAGMKFTITETRLDTGGSGNIRLIPHYFLTSVERVR